jgi:hypothetical protein
MKNQPIEPVLREKDGDLYYVKGSYELLISARGISVTVAKLKLLSASSAQRFLIHHDLEMPLTCPSEIYVPVVASFVQLTWLQHYFHAVDPKIKDRHDKRVERFKIFLKTGEMPDSYIQPNKKTSDVLQKRYILKEGTKTGGGQRGVVFDSLKRLGPATIAELTADVVKGGKLTTRQEPERIVRYYIVLHRDKEVLDAPAD